MSIATATQAKTETSSAPTKYTLNATHRCDAGGEQAYVNVLLTSDLNLMFCRHHFNQHKGALYLTGLIDSIVDETDRLVENRLVGTEN